MRRKWWLVIDAWIIEEVEKKNSRSLAVPQTPFSLFPSEEIQHKRENSDSSFNISQNQVFFWCYLIMPKLFLPNTYFIECLKACSGNFLF